MKFKALFCLFPTYYSSVNCYLLVDSSRPRHFPGFSDTFQKTSGHACAAKWWLSTAD